MTHECQHKCRIRMVWIANLGVHHHVCSNCGEVIGESTPSPNTRKLSDGRIKDCDTGHVYDPPQDPNEGKQ